MVTPPPTTLGEYDLGTGNASIWQCVSTQSVHPRPGLHSRARRSASRAAATTWLRSRLIEKEEAPDHRHDKHERALDFKGSSGPEKWDTQ